MSGPQTKVKAGKTDDDPSIRHITLRGVDYTIREIDTNEYDDIITGLADANGAVRFDKLLKAMVLKCVTPLPSKPWKFPVYRTLEAIVNEMHYTDLADEAEKPAEDDGPEAEATEEAAPNS